MTKFADIILTITVTLYLAYICLLGLIYQTLTDHPSYQNTTLDKWTPIMGICGLALIIYSLFSKTKTKYLLTRVSAVVFILPLIIIDSLSSYPSDNPSDKIISATFNLPNIILLVFLTLSIFRQRNLQT
jgi:predicted Na+-dependent transporter